MEAEAVRLKAEVQVVQNDEGGHDSLEGRLKDFEGEEELEPENVPTLLVNGDKTEYTVTPKRDSEVQPLKVKFGNQETLSQANGGVQAAAALTLKAKCNGQQSYFAVLFRPSTKVET